MAQRVTIVRSDISNLPSEKKRRYCEYCSFWEGKIVYGPKPFLCYKWNSMKWYNNRCKAFTDNGLPTYTGSPVPGIHFNKYR